VDIEGRIHLGDGMSENDWSIDNRFERMRLFGMSVMRSHLEVIAPNVLYPNHLDRPILRL
jgi:hypothetical protein